MDSKKWGPYFWKVMHIVSFSYPDNPSHEDKKNYYNFYNNLQNILPCEYCRKNLKKNYKLLPLNSDVLRNSSTLSKYIYDLHELVNKELNKKSYLSYNDVKIKYDKYKITCKKKS